MTKIHSALSVSTATSSTESPTGSVALGKLLSGSTPGALLVDFTGNIAGPLSARTTVKVDVEQVRQAVDNAQSVVLLFENGDVRLPIITGFVQQPMPHLELVAPTLHIRAHEMNPQETKVTVEGKRVVLEGQEEVSLKCGKASITLKADGRVVVRGAYVETYSKGVNRIKGGVVKIN